MRKRGAVRAAVGTPTSTKNLKVPLLGAELSTPLSSFLAQVGMSTPSPLTHTSAKMVFH